ncbi:hypothetical protein AAJCM20276_06110 [Acetobacter aceti]|uniref:Uncharacterized protein n=1 Tax=Acetobacter aceti TaxID=435 RepID=A0A6S6PB43_ACEAC|nr:hypothetical protein AAJCM20276_06110 [Acetobacter aceti]
MFEKRVPPAGQKRAEIASPIWGDADKTQRVRQAVCDHLSDRGGFFLAVGGDQQGIRTTKMLQAGLYAVFQNVRVKGVDDNSNPGEGSREGGQARRNRRLSVIVQQLVMHAFNNPAFLNAVRQVMHQRVVRAGPEMPALFQVTGCVEQGAGITLASCAFGQEMPDEIIRLPFTGR